MLKYLETTCLILLWVGLFGFLFVFFCYHYVHFKRGRIGPIARLFVCHLPSLPLAGILIFLSFQILGVVLIYPVHFLAGFHDLIFKSMPPAIVLLIASGFAKTSLCTLMTEYRYWSQRPFVLTLEGYGIEGQKKIGPLIILRTLCLCWSSCLPWLFGELIIVESLFNAPGLGLDVWQTASSRDYTALAHSIGLVMILFMLCFGIQTLLNHWLGKKLEGYI